MITLSDIVPHLSETAARLRDSGEADTAQALDELCRRLLSYGALTVEELPLKSPSKAPDSPAPIDDSTIAEEQEVLRKLSLLFQHVDTSGDTLTSIRQQIEEITAPVKLPSLRRLGKTFLHLPLAKRNKQEIIDLIYSQVARRKERTSW